jgi:hypothetical protein
MAKDIRYVVCGMCTNKCRVAVTLEGGKIISQEYARKEKKSKSAGMWNSIVILSVLNIAA